MPLEKGHGLGSETSTWAVSESKAGPSQGPCSPETGMVNSPVLKTGRPQSRNQAWHYLFSSPKPQFWLLKAFFSLSSSLHLLSACDRWPHFDQCNNCPNRASIMGLGFNSTAGIIRGRSLEAFLCLDRGFKDLGNISRSL